MSPIFKWSVIALIALVLTIAGLNLAWRSNSPVTDEDSNILQSTVPSDAEAAPRSEYQGSRKVVPVQVSAVRRIVIKSNENLPIEGASLYSAITRNDRGFTAGTLIGHAGSNGIIPLDEDNRGNCFLAKSKGYAPSLVQTTGLMTEVRLELGSQVRLHFRDRHGKPVGGVAYRVGSTAKPVMLGDEDSLYSCDTSGTAWEYHSVSDKNGNGVVDSWPIGFAYLNLNSEDWIATSLPPNIKCGIGGAALDIRLERPWIILARPSGRKVITWACSKSVGFNFVLRGSDSNRWRMLARKKFPDLIALVGLGGTESSIGPAQVKLLVEGVGWHTVEINPQPFKGAVPIDLDLSTLPGVPSGSLSIRLLGPSGAELKFPLSGLAKLVLVPKGAGIGKRIPIELGKKISIPVGEYSLEHYIPNRQLQFSGETLRIRAGDDFVHDAVMKSPVSFLEVVLEGIEKAKTQGSVTLTIAKDGRTMQTVGIGGQATGFKTLVRSGLNEISVKCKGVVVAYEKVNLREGKVEKLRIKIVL